MAEGGRVGGGWRGVGKGRRTACIRTTFGICSGSLGSIPMVGRGPSAVGLSAAWNTGHRDEGGAKCTAALVFWAIFGGGRAEIGMGAPHASSRRANLRRIVSGQESVWLAVISSTEEPKKGLTKLARSFQAPVIIGDSSLWRALNRQGGPC